MYKPSRAAADAHFTTKQKQNKQIQKEKDKEREERKVRMAKLRALRLSQEVAGVEVSEPEGLKTAAPKSR
jgi:hypothetical protein